MVSYIQTYAEIITLYFHLYSSTRRQGCTSPPFAPGHGEQIFSHLPIVFHDGGYLILVQLFTTYVFEKS